MCALWDSLPCSLRELTLQHCNITKLTASISRLGHLSKLEVDNGKWVRLPFQLHCLLFVDVYAK